jgi:23S rRNA (uracil1939-C5)-methyltransferase
MYDIKYPIGVRSFMQVNYDVCKMLYKSVVDFIDADDQTVVLDAYSGAGLMTALLSKNAKKAIGIEIIPEATSLANELAVQNGLSNKIINYNGKCEEIMPDIIQKELENNSKIRLVIDPPRKGCDIKVIDAILKCNIDRIVYVSCLPQSLARDIGLIVGSLKVENGEVKRATEYTPRYKIESVQPFDMFPQTNHVETVVCLKR